VNKMKKLLTLYALALALSIAATASAQTPQTQPAQSGDASRPATQRIIGEVTGIDAAAGRISIRTDAGETLTVAVDDKTKYMRLPPGETTMEKAVGVTREDVRVGDRVLVPDASSSSAQAAARRVILMGRAPAAGAQGERGRDDGRRLNGRVASIDAAKKQIAVLTRGREGVETVTLDAAGDVRILRYAPDTLRVSEARPSSFAELKVGDQLRATGERATDGSHFKPEEIVAGSFTRVFGVVTATDAARGEASVKSEQTGQTVTVALGKNSTLKRLTTEFVETLEERMQRAERREQRRASGEQRQTRENRGEGRGGRAGRRDGEGERQGDGVRGGEGAGGRGGRNPQQMFESLPSVTLADLKKGDAVVVTASTGADDAHVTAISLVTGEADFMRRLRRGTDGAPRGMSPGLPGDVLGGGTGGDVRGREQQPPF
jgi:Cu/Ag efflux protein CusF